MKSILVANWKNYPDSLAGAAALLAGLSKKRVLYKKLSLYIAPPLTYFEAVSNHAGGFSHLASQDLPPLAGGTHTGLVSLDILKSFGVRLSIIGHSEQRALGETDGEVARKVKLAQRAGITPLVCVGEKVRDEEGEHLEFLRHQLKRSLEGLKRREAKKLMVAYEPLWAIGKRARDAVRPDDLTESVIFIRKVLADLFDREAADKVAILYGGSVEPSNANELYEKTGIRGFLVGHASLDAGDFSKIAETLIR